MMNLSQQPHAVQQIDADGEMIVISRQWYEEAKAKLAAYEDTGLSPEYIARIVKTVKECGVLILKK